jgi:hypothetical protein
MAMARHIDPTGSLSVRELERRQPINKEHPNRSSVELKV